MNGSIEDQCRSDTAHRYSDTSTNGDYDSAAFLPSELPGPEGTLIAARQGVEQATNNSHSNSWEHNGTLAELSFYNEGSVSTSQPIWFSTPQDGFNDAYLAPINPSLPSTVTYDSGPLESYGQETFRNMVLDLHYTILIKADVSRITKIFRTTTSAPK